MKQDIIVRKKKFDFNNSPKYYYKNALITHFFNALSATFPPGEDFFVRSVRHFRKNNKSTLEKEISAFIGQEAWHSLAHETLNQYATQHNINLKDWETKIDYLLKNAERVLTPKLCLAVTIALEHYTATMGNEILTNKYWINNFKEPYKELILWHSTEEVEHKSVAFDVYLREADDINSYIIRCLIMIISSIIFWIIISYMTLDIYIKDKTIKNKNTQFMFGIYELLRPNGFITNIMKDIPKYFKYTFHPSENN